MARPTQWTLEKIKETAAKYTELTDFINQDNGAYRAAHRMGILDSITKHMNRIQRGAEKKWTLPALKCEAKKFKTMAAFRKGNRAAYVVAHRDGHLDAITVYLGGQSGGDGSP